jgi:hypothetical protein
VPVCERDEEELLGRIGKKRGFQLTKCYRERKVEKGWIDLETVRGSQCKVPISFFF